MTLIDLTGYLAAIGTTGAFIPQTIKVFRTKRTEDLSLRTFLFLSLGIILWIIYGVFLSSIPIILANSITLFMTGYILYMIIKHKKN